MSNKLQVILMTRQVWEMLLMDIQGDTHLLNLFLGVEDSFAHL